MSEPDSDIRGENPSVNDVDTCDNQVAEAVVINIMFLRLFVLFTVVPVAELALIIHVGRRIGTWNTVTVVLLTAIIGAYMVRLEGLGVMARLQENLAHGQFPRDELIDGALVLVAGALLLTPGFITDGIGFLFVFPPTRAGIRGQLVRYLKRRTGGTGMPPF